MDPTDFDGSCKVIEDSQVIGDSVNMLPSFRWREVEISHSNECPGVKFLI